MFFFPFDLQTEQSLKNLQSNIAIYKLKGILDLQEELAANKIIGVGDERGEQPTPPRKKDTTTNNSPSTIPTAKKTEL